MKKRLICVPSILLASLTLASCNFAGGGKKDENRPHATAEATETSYAEPETSSLPSSPYEPGKYVTGGDYSVYLRVTPGTDADSLASIPAGVPFTVTELFDSGSGDETLRWWGRVSYNGWNGYVAMYYTKEYSGYSEYSTEPTTGKQPNGEILGLVRTPGSYKTAAATKLNIRNGHSGDAQILGTLSPGTAVTVVEVYEDRQTENENLRYWGKISYETYTGWISMYYLVEE